VRDQTFGIVGDDSTGVDVAAGQTITATGTGGITVSVANDTITIDGSGVADSDNQTLSFDGTNLSITGGNSVDLSSLGGAGITFTGDDSAGINIADGGQIYIQGGTGISTSANSDGTITITNTQTGGGANIGNLEVTGTNSQTLSGTVTNADIIIEPNGTGNIVANGMDIDRFDSTHDAENYDTIQLAPPGDDTGRAQLWLKVDGSESYTENSIRYQSYSGKHIFYHSAGNEVKLTTDLGDALKLCVNENQSGGSITIPSSTSGDIVIDPGGKIQLDQNYWPNTDGTSGQVLSTNGSGVLSWISPSGLGIDNVVDDTTPQLGGDLDLNSNDITGTGNITHTGNITTTGNISSTGSIGNDAVTINDNKITTSRSNDDLYVVAAGDGYVQLGKELDADPVSSFADLPYNTGTFTYASGDINASSSSSRFYGHQRILDGTVTTGGTNNFVRSRIIDEVGIDVNGNSWNQSSRGGGAGIIHFITVKNTSDGSTGAINWPQGNNSGILLAPSGTASGATVNISNMAAYRSVSQNFEQSTDTFAITNNYGYYATPMFDTGPGTVTITNDYSFYADYTNTPRINATNQYAFYSDNDAIANRLGGINFQSDQIQAADSNDDLKIAENGTGRVNMVVSTQGSAGTVAGYMKMKVNGTEYAVPYYNLS
jgi:hypothetical protein